MSERTREAVTPPSPQSESLRARLAGLDALEREFQELQREAAKTIALAESFRDPMPAILTKELASLWEDGSAPRND